MWTLLASLLLAPALASDGDVPMPQPLTGKEYRQLAKDLAAEDARYRRGRTLLRVGNVVAATGFATYVVGIGIHGEIPRPWDDVVGYSALSLYALGPLVGSAGALESGGALQQRGVDVDRSAAWVGLGLASAGVALPLVTIGLDAGLEAAGQSPTGVSGLGALALLACPPSAAIAANLQMLGPNRTAIPPKVTMLPMRTQHGSGLAIRASF